jgi:hypothetical protein
VKGQAVDVYELDADGDVLTHTSTYTKFSDGAQTSFKTVYNRVNKGDQKHE